MDRESEAGYDPVNDLGIVLAALMRQEDYGQQAAQEALQRLRTGLGLRGEPYARTVASALRRRLGRRRPA